MNDPDKHPSASPLTFSMLTSEGVRKLVCLIERIARRSMKTVLKPNLFLFRCLYRG